MQKITITLQRDSNNNWTYDVYRGADDFSENADFELVDGGVCTTDITSALGMVIDIINENL